MHLHKVAMKVLITWGSKMGGTEGIARVLAEPLEKAGHTVTLMPAATAPDVSGFDAAVIGGALYAFRWHRDADRFIARNLRGLRKAQGVQTLSFPSIRGTHALLIDPGTLYIFGGWSTVLTKPLP